MYISTNVYITAGTGMFSLSGNLGTEYLSGGSYKEKGKKER